VKRIKSICLGFTLLELLVTISIIALLSALILPPLARSRAQALNIVCINHFKQLTTCWRMYADDNNGKLASVFYFVGGQVNSNAWVRGRIDDNLDYPPIEPGVLDSTNLNGIRWGSLYSYNNDTDIYHCPADKSMTAGIPRVRSYSLNGWMGGTYVHHQSNYYVFKRESDIVNPSPSKAFVFIDEHEASINDGWFAVDMVGTWGLLDCPATRHYGSYGLSFADGHGEIWKLTDSRTMNWKKLPYDQMPAQNFPPNTDWRKLQFAASSLNQTE
jgi:prepilin-type N-terminal cleavage/methylation domain-containing protein